ncbi:hypothetical protein FJK98_02340 [Micromonospora sp. HM134]|uniref:hypothetical protein n=1 Tax=Micromonospora sp. HM134 TaxID=2583243 RepID=UPI00119846DA|nr:hypothetical protein [Micromonospora sp. HM134]QDY06144.1 hypothetical protein FJK98_02340 [Micromonospora sp. HM134]
MIPIRVPANATVHTQGIRTLRPEHHLHGQDCPVCDGQLGGEPVVLVYVGAHVDDRATSGWMTGAAVVVHAACAGVDGQPDAHADGAYTAADIRTAEMALAALWATPGTTPECMGRAVLAALAAAGRLIPTHPAPTDVDSARVLAALAALGWEDDRRNPEHPGALYSTAEEAIRAADRLTPGGGCPCTCHRPDDCPCPPGAPAHRHGAGRYCIADQTGHDPADPREAADRLYIAATALEANLRPPGVDPADLPADHVELIQALAAYPAPSVGRHVLVVADDGTWTVEHPAGCTVHTPTGPAVICIVGDLAAEQLPTGLPGGRYEVAANDLADRLLIGDRLDSAEG